MSRSTSVNSGTAVCALALIFGTTILTGLFSMMLAVARHPQWCPCQAEADDFDYLEAEDGPLPGRTAS
ncbi:MULTISPECIES: hypothetical protein [unclassified Streptomyces]|uniref:hypothetical protein n=1 Tax=unclassified Streptomyces TaxID=2593676 RepID=UPI002E28D1A6|nr:hypothetical protein [Streptomyces sp. NBC_00285]